MTTSRKSLFSKLKKAILIFIAIPLSYVVGVIIYGTIYDYTPPPSEPIPFQGKVGANIPQEFSLITWNIGYAGLGAKMDFFYDGGKRVRPDEAEWQDYFDGVRETLAKFDSVDFFLLQEVDSASKRSYYNDEVTKIANSLPGFGFGYAKNYDVPFVPRPYLSPMGAVKSGIAIFSKYQPDSLTRYTYPGNYSWPKKPFLLDRCFLVFRKKLPSGKELVLINTHNSAYDKGNLKRGQMEKLKEYVLPEYEKGNYVIVGGDWNQCPPYFDPASLSKRIPHKWKPTNIEPDFYPPDWQWMYDAVIPTHRSLSKPYDGKTNFKTVIDFYLCSPNVEVERVKGIYLGFEDSDHQPVYMKIRLKP